MEIRQRIRKVFEPLTVKTDVEISGQLAQVYDSIYGKWDFMRSETSPLILRPRVKVSAQTTNSGWTDGDYTSQLAQVAWYANGTLVSEVQSLKFETEVATEDEDRGALRMWHNLTPGETFDLVMKAKLKDPRDNSLIDVVSEPVNISVTEKSQDEWDLSVVHDVNIDYHPLLDRLKEYDYLVDNGKMEASDTARLAYCDGNQYDLRLPIIISRGSYVIDSNDEAWDKCTIKLKQWVKKTDGSSERTDFLTQEDGNPLSFVKAVSRTSIDLDLRLVPGGTVIEAELCINGEKMGSEFLTFSVIVDNIDVQMVNSSNLVTTGRYRHDRVICSVNGRQMLYPDAYLFITWYTETTNGIVCHGTGSECDIDIQRANPGINTECWMDVYVDVKVRKQLAAITDEQGTVITNEEGSPIVGDMII